MTNRPPPDLSSIGLRAKTLGEDMMRLSTAAPSQQQDEYISIMGRARDVVVRLQALAKHKGWI